MNELELAIQINKALGLPTENLTIIKSKLVSFELIEVKPVELPVCCFNFFDVKYKI